MRQKTISLKRLGFVFDVQIRWVLLLFIREEIYSVMCCALTQYCLMITCSSQYFSLSSHAVSAVGLHSKRNFISTELFDTKNSIFCGEIYIKVTENWSKKYWITSVFQYWEKKLYLFVIPILPTMCLLSDIWLKETKGMSTLFNSCFVRIVIIRQKYFLYLSHPLVSSSVMQIYD